MSVQAAHTNRLAGETSPYLLQHAHNPVDWYSWGEEAFRRAGQEGKPILLSVGYSACHWCHVMERESFENEEIAALMNAHFVNVKVDREERPDVDHIYMTAVQMMTGQGGWPMTVFLTPEGKPFYAGTYFPPDDRYGRPGFPRVLQAVAEAWRDRRQEIEQQGDAITAHIKEGMGLDLAPMPVTADLFDRAFEALRRSFDSRMGGFGGAPKFPQPMILDFLLRYAHRTKRQEPLDMVRLTLDKMAQGGMYDQIGGGFHRYSTDAYWLVPHFEKMLYDNAQLAVIYLRGYQVTGDPFYRRITEETLDYVLREMTSQKGGFYSSQDADSEGEEGKYFVWTPREVEAFPGEEDAELFCRFYDITDRGNFEGKSIPNTPVDAESFARSQNLDLAGFALRIARLRAKMLEARDERVKPGRDDKILVAWNGLMLAAFAEAGAVLEREDYVRAAAKNADFVVANLYKDGRLLRTGKQDGNGFRAVGIPGFLEDYACYADGLLRLYEATSDIYRLERARELANRMIELFWDEFGFYGAEDAETRGHGDGVTRRRGDSPSPHVPAATSPLLVVRPRDLMDNATPSGNSVAVDVLLRLGVLTGEESYREHAAGILRKLAAAMERQPLGFGRLLQAADFFVGPVQELAVVGDPGLEETRALLRVARAGYRPNLIAAAAPPGDPAASQLPLFADRGAIEGQPTAYLCENYACRRPTTEPKELEEMLGA